MKTFSQRWHDFLCPQCLQYDFCHSLPLVIGEKQEQSHPTVPEQCFPCVVACVWISVAVKTALEDADVEAEAAAAQKPSAVAEMATMARVSIVFFIVSTLIRVGHNF